ALSRRRCHRLSVATLGQKRPSALTGARNHLRRAAAVGLLGSAFLIGAAPAGSVDAGAKASRATPDAGTPAAESPRRADPSASDKAEIARLRQEVNELKARQAAADAKLEDTGSLKDELRRLNEQMAGLRGEMSQAREADNQAREDKAQRQVAFERSLDA